ncbi:MAG: tRNA pseudouridine(38-40) synthase TruA [Ignavibacterium sp.]|nr:tRNA pseudouridine(38-40) synthase TruA [Ignavibacterium sp.]
MRKSKSWIKGESKSKSKSWNKPESSRFQTKANKQKIFSRFKLILEYEGTRYSGWQKQQNARTIQGELIKACEQIFGDDFIDLQGSGRTDSGVHAISQVAHLDINTMLAPHIIQMRINDLLPYDINILYIEKTDKNFHTRHSAKSRSYLYQISKRRNAFEKNHIWWVKDKLDFEAMKNASKLFIGMNDFSSFSDDDPEEKSTKVVIDDIDLSEKEDLIFIRITGSHFIWKMVRRIVGVLVEVGRGKMSDKDILFYLNNKSGEPAKYTAPPSGLFLETVIY